MSDLKEEIISARHGTDKLEAYKVSALLLKCLKEIEDLQAKVKALEEENKALEINLAKRGLKILELATEKKKSFWHAFEHVVLNPESRNIQRAWEKWLEWEKIKTSN